ncbi:phosphoribosylamine--glycine ligase [Anaerosporomusa subterranea]|uniref:Phosphoribosylamine--glycine ligase n=1 Tax=Anaerosporomusa subterranea TaxID=1794912 RepID=A0A154BMK2_ANASB|nr:phosphoribosylamine--glycine ligase [Anaerosporomusa subterranea]KYZ75213.1 phosphoribosylamine--glycine ligase [Anaerosporomusa subterranea]
MNILVIGGGGREHALVSTLAKSRKVAKIYCAPGNPGIAAIAECVDIDIADNELLCRFAQEKSIGLTVVGPEAPLMNGIVDFFAANGLRAFGPTRAAAEIEGSKSFAKDLMRKYHIPTAAYAVFSSPDAAKDYVRQQGAPIVIKADGLAAGKGVVVAMTEAEALAAIDTILCQQAFGQAGSQVVIEEYMEGEEASILTFTDGYTVRPMVAAQDHKRIFDGDEGPNTGGMGAYAPAPVITPALLDTIIETILQPVVNAMTSEGRNYKGCLYLGLMMTKSGPKVVEFNARFGDPETQVVLPLLASDLVDVLEACIDGSLDNCDLVWHNRSAVCVVLAAGGYPGEYRKGDAINGIAEAEAAGGMVFHAGTANCDGQLVTAGGRVLGVTGVNDTVASAINNAYQAVAKIQFKGMQYRTDIAHRAQGR